MLGEPENQFSLTRAAPSTDGRAKSKFLSVQPDRPLQKKDFRNVEISTNGLYYLDRQKTSLDMIVANLVADYKRNTNLVVRIRADGNGRTRDLYAVIDRCRKKGITRMDLRTEPEPTR